MKKKQRRLLVKQVAVIIIRILMLRLLQRL